MSFLSPSFFYLLFLLPLLAFWQYRQRSSDAIRYPSLSILSQSRPSRRQRLLFLPPLCLYLALACLITCLARPQRELSGQREDREGIAIQLLVDVSSSMESDIQTQDGPMSRMEVAKKVIEQFVVGNDQDLKGRPDDMIGVISFARYSDSICPMTLGHDALVHIVRDLTINDRQNEDGTAYGDATALAAARLKASDKEDGQPKSKVILLLTDGENNCGEHLPLQAAAMAQQWGIRIYTVSLQDEAKALSVKTDKGNFLRPAQPSESELVLEKMAVATGGIFRSAHDLESLLSVYREINELEKSKIREVSYSDTDEAYPPFVFAALLLLLIRYGLNATLLRIAP